MAVDRENIEDMQTLLSICKTTGKSGLAWLAANLRGDLYGGDTLHAAQSRIPSETAMRIHDGEKYTDIPVSYTSGKFVAQYDQAMRFVPDRFDPDGGSYYPGCDLEAKERAERQMDRLNASLFSGIDVLKSRLTALGNMSAEPAKPFQGMIAKSRLEALLMVRSIKTETEYGQIEGRCSVDSSQLVRFEGTWTSPESESQVVAAYIEPESRKIVSASYYDGTPASDRFAPALQEAIEHQAMRPILDLAAIVNQDRQSKIIRSFQSAVPQMSQWLDEIINYREYERSHPEATLTR